MPSSSELLTQLRSLLSSERDLIANLSNAAALLFGELPDVNWAGFYLTQGKQLVLGPFQGKPACVRIDFGRGVCGTAAMRRETVVVPDVHYFPGHIACDSASQSEVVVPLIANDAVMGVLDVDSPCLNRFQPDDVLLLEQAALLIVEASEISNRGVNSLHTSHSQNAVEFLQLVTAGKIREAYERHIAVNFKHHNPYFRGDRESLFTAMEENKARFPNKKLEVRQTFEGEDRAAVHSRVKLSDAGPEMSLVHLFRFEGEKIAELWDVGQPVPADCPNENGLF